MSAMPPLTTHAPTRDNRTEDTQTDSLSTITQEDALFQKFMEVTLSINPLYYQSLAIFISIGLVANVVLICYLIKSKKYQQQTFTFILSLVVSDLCMCISADVYMFFLYPLMPMRLPEFVCSYGTYFLNVSMAASLAHLVFFAFMRYFQLVHPLKTKVVLTVSMVAKACLFIWVLSMVISVPFIWLSGKRDVPFKGEIIRYCDFYGSYALRDILIHFLNYFLPWVIIISLHIAKQLRMRKSTKDAGQPDKRNTVQKALVTMVALFFVTWVPSFVHDIAHEMFGLPYEPSHPVLFLITCAVLYMNSAINPFIYMFMAKPIRKDIVKELLPCLVKSKHK